MQLERLAADLSYALRMMRRNPGFTLVAVLTLALGIGVNATLFTAYNAVVLKPLPIADPSSVFRFERWFVLPSRGNIQYAFSYPEYMYVRDHSRAFTSLVAASWNVKTFAEWQGGGANEKMMGQLVSANYFPALGIRPRLGPGFAPDADRVPGASPVIVISHACWQEKLNGDPGVAGKIVRLNGRAFTVVGVAPEEFTGTAQSGYTPDFWAPLSMQAQLAPGVDWLHSRDHPSVQILARVRPGMPVPAARGEAALLVRQFGAGRTPREKTADVTLQRTSYLDNADDPRFQAAVAGVMLVVGMVLAVACANLANMMLARGAMRHHEIGVRLALGAGRGRVMRQLLTESATLGVLGGAVGLGLSIWLSRLLVVWVEQAIPAQFGGGLRLPVDFSPDLRVALYTLGVSIGSGLLFGLSPALQLTRTNPTAALKDEGPSFGGRLTRSRLRSVLVAGQVAVSMTLLITAGLLTRGLVRSRVAEPGFETRTVYFLRADLGSNPAAARARQRRVLDRLQPVPGVSHVAEGDVPLLGTWTPPVLVDGVFHRSLGSYASDTYLETLGIPIEHGRGFTRQEVDRSAAVAVISEAAARRFWPSQDPLGRRFRIDMDWHGTMAEYEVIGVVKDVRYGNLTRLDPAHIYLPPRAGDLPGALVRIQGDPRTALAAIRGAVQAEDPDLMPGLVLMSLEEGPVWFQKIQSQAAAYAVLALATLALVLAGAGIYGVMGYLVSQRTREIGIRMALGAGAREVVREVVGGALRPVIAGIAIGIAGAAALSAVLHSTLKFPGSSDFLYGLSFYDPATFLGLAAFVLAVAAVASAAPARKAVKVDPVVALRYE